MQAKAINPFPFIGQRHKDALDFIILNLPPNPTFDNLNDIVVASAFAPDPVPSTDAGLEIYLPTVLPSAYNRYVNSAMPGAGGEISETMVSITAKYTPNQLLLINK